MATDIITHVIMQADSLTYAYVEGNFHVVIKISFLIKVKIFSIINIPTLDTYVHHIFKCRASIQLYDTKINIH